MSCLHECGGGWVLARDIARCTGTPQPYLSKLLHSPVRRGLIVAKRGYQGGFALARAPDQISLLDVAEAIEGEQTVPRCLLGNFDWRGGMIKATTFDFRGKGKRFDLESHPGKISSFGVSSIRHGVDYEKTTLFSGYPAKRNWYPLSSDMYEEILPSIGDAYPYPIKALFFYMGTPTYGLPAGHTNIGVLADVEKLPLFFASDILIGTTSMYADYNLPDLSFLERWEFQGSHPNIPNKVQPVRQPVIAPIPESCTVFGQQVPLSFEALPLGVAEYLTLPGFGDIGFGTGGGGEPLPLRHPDDLYLRAATPAQDGIRPGALADHCRRRTLAEGGLRPVPRRTLRRSREGIQG